MKLINKLATAGAVAAMGLGLGAASASAVGIDLSPNPYAFSGSQVGVNSFTAGDSTVECETAEFSGNTSNSTNLLIPFTATYDDCSTDFLIFAFPATVTTHSDWQLAYSSGSAAGSVNANVNLLAPPSGPAVTISIPAVGCTISIPAQSGLSAVTAANVVGGVGINAAVSDIAYTSTGFCPGVGASGSDGQYNGSVNIPGITMSDH